MSSRHPFAGVVARGRGRKKGWKSKTEGSVSIFLIMVLAFVFLFSTVLIDYARIAAVNVQGERLVRAGARSVLSAYDIELKERYGLFAFGNSDGNMLLSKVLNDSLHKSGRGDTFNILPLALNSSSLEWSRPLGEYDIFRREIIEDMKYKAPVDFALELAGKFKPLSAAMAEASRTTEVLSELQPLYDKREEALDLMFKKRKQAAESGSSLLRWIMNPPGDELYSTYLGEVNTAADVAAKYDDYIQKYFADMNRDTREPPRHTYELDRFVRQASQVIARIHPSLATFVRDHERLMEEAENALRNAKELNEEMRVVLEKSRNSAPDPGSDPARNWDIPGSSDESGTVPLEKLREQEDSLIMSPADFENMGYYISVQRETFQRIEPEVSGLPEVLNWKVDSNSSVMISAVLGASRAIYTYLQNYGDHGVIIASESASIEERRSLDNQRKQIEKEAKSKLGDAMKLLDSIRELSDKSGEAMERYGKLRQYYEENIAFNKSLEQNSPSDHGVDSDPYAAGKSSMENMDGIYGAIGSIMGGARDRLFQTEYSALYFPHFDVSELTSLASGSEGNAGGQLLDQLDPHAQELEYILYGFHNPAGNVAAAYGEIFAMRLAIRTMEGFIEKAGAGHPLLVLAGALLYGINMAIQDMLQLCREGSVPLSKYMRAQMTYRDHLRLFMMLHGGGEVQLSRMLALIRLNTGINPAERNTYVSSEIKLGMRLWFLPGVIRLLNYSGGIPGDVQGSTYYRTVQADFAY